VIDGEVAIYDQQLRSRFRLREPDPDAVASPPLLMVFHLLFQDHRDLTVRPLRDSCARLEDVVAGSELVSPVRRLAPDGLDAWAQVPYAAMEAPGEAWASPYAADGRQPVASAGVAGRASGEPRTLMRAVRGELREASKTKMCPVRSVAACRRWRRPFRGSHGADERSRHDSFRRSLTWF
jgi:hypothetical protein